MWVFGYGSLIWKVDFPFQAKRIGQVKGYVRRFWQKSTDHRGTVEQPGRVVTLIPFQQWKTFTNDPDYETTTDTCYGIAYKIAEADIPQVMSHLDYREKDGYDKQQVLIHTDQGDVEATLYYGSIHGSSFGGPDPRLAEIIATARGDSGSNQEYFVNLLQQHRQLFGIDPHLESLAQQLV